MILLGINSSGLIHYGNYISIIKPVMYYNLKRIFLADMHSLSKRILTFKIIKNKIIISLVVLSFFKNIYYYQSINKNILKLFWLILCFYNKNKSKFFHSLNKKKFLSFGKLCYPLLMCSDIISTNNKFIFVGIDQLQHIELYKKIKNKINFFFGFNIIKKNIFIVNNKILYSYNKKKMSKTNKNSLFIFSNFKEINVFINKFKNTQKKKKSILNFSLNIINNNLIRKIFFYKNINVFKKIVLVIIHEKFVVFKKLFLLYLKNIEKNIFRINKNNYFLHNISNLNLNNLFNKINL
ncbi:hypothetical protein V7Z24_00820 [Candidatus Carsonella ruddii]|uniref:hypothetical protein n=1 Tax=Carsonella ruddii TaxID=114186 RepID=UPI003D814D33